jgi:hypothetical protein
VISLPDAVAAGDLDALIRLVDGYCSAREWGMVVELRDRCRHALEQRGLQLWPAAEYAEYRLALDAPGSHAGPVVDTEAGRFALGPLWEVAASTHEWKDLRDHLPPGPTRALCAHERVLRGEDLSTDESVDRGVLDLPLRVLPWEPSYPVATYRSDEADFPAPDLPPLAVVELPDANPPIDDEESIEALLDIGSVWARQSNGMAEAVSVEGTAAEAIGALGHDAVRMAPITADEALALIGWAGASGGAYGRRRGGPVGRFAAWWLTAALADLEWPVEPSSLADAAAGLEWQVWEPLDLAPGWSACLAIASSEHGLAWALEAHDAFREGDDPTAEAAPETA